MATVTITSFGLEAGTDRKLYVNWSWNKEHTKSFSVHWMYGTSGNFNNGEYDAEDLELFNALTNK